MMNSIERAIVSKQDPDNYAVFVQLLGRAGGSGALLSVPVATAGPRDAVRGHFPPLPLPGQSGLVAFTNGDARNGVWLCSTPSQLQDASGHTPGRGGEEHSSHYGGGFSFRAHDGSWTEHFPEGTSITVGASGAMPTRHRVNAGSQARERKPYTMAERIPNPPAAFPVTLRHPSNASAVLSSSGTWTITSPGGAQVVLDSTGSVTIVAATSLTVVAGTTANVTAATSVTVNSPSILLGSAAATQFVRLANNAASTVVKAL